MSCSLTLFCCHDDPLLIVPRLTHEYVIDQWARDAFDVTTRSLSGESKLIQGYDLNDNDGIPCPPPLPHQPTGRGYKRARCIGGTSYNLFEKMASRSEGTSDKLMGSAKETFGNVTGNERLQAKQYS
ncbi:hypothetical protein BC832DRAFT_169379 [Gaertneriomyces semiglobifer]|nr:hypothetical protein BC832DRAFT_169379 [Gaertneriomyces semiglobifer]